MDDEEGANNKSQAIFEFTKRKRWADVLVSELVNVAILVLSPSGSIIHVDAAVHGVTGYSEDQLLGKNFSDILHGSFAFVTPPMPTLQSTTYIPALQREMRSHSFNHLKIVLQPVEN